MQNSSHHSRHLHFLWSALVHGCIAICSVSNQSAVADDWMTWSSTYTHDPVTLHRVDQYSPGVQPISPVRSDFQRSGYRHYRSTLQTGQSADNIHIVEQWGRPVVPYEQWRYPFRPYGVPYPAWGPQAPYGIINGQFGYGGGYPYGIPNGLPNANPVWGNNPPGAPNLYRPNTSAGFPLQPDYMNQPWFDGSYPDAPPLDPRSDREFFYNPSNPPQYPVPPTTTTSP